MTKPKRFNLKHGPDYVSEVELSKEGKFILYKDYKILQNKLNEIQEEANKLKKQLVKG